MTLPSQSAGHTPGPWQLVSDPYADGKPYFQFTAGGGNYPDGFHIAGILSQADARLIARAPDLLAENSKLKGQLEEAVKALTDAASAIDYVSTFVPADEPITEHNENCIAAVARFNALLSKLKEAGS